MLKTPPSSGSSHWRNDHSCSLLHICINLPVWTFNSHTRLWHCLLEINSVVSIAAGRVSLDSLIATFPPIYLTINISRCSLLLTDISGHVWTGSARFGSVSTRFHWYTHGVWACATHLEPTHLKRKSAKAKDCPAVNCQFAFSVLGRDNGTESASVDKHRGPNFFVPGSRQKGSKLARWHSTQRLRFHGPFPTNTGARIPPVRQTMSEMLKKLKIDNRKIRNGWSDGVRTPWQWYNLVDAIYGHSKEREGERRPRPRKNGSRGRWVVFSLNVLFCL